MSAYRSAEGLNWSHLKMMATSPRAFKHTPPKEPTPAMALGTAFHALVLEGKKPVVFTGATRRGKEWDAFKAEHEGQTIVNSAEAETLTAMSAALAEHDGAQSFLHACEEYEAPIFWDERGTQAKACLDGYGPTVLLDLKTTSDLAGFRNDAARRLYHGQMAWYRRALRSTGCNPDTVVLVVVESVAPYDVAAFVLDPDTLYVGDTVCDRLLTRYQECVASGVWPGAYPGTTTLSLPTWAQGAWT